MTWVETTGQKCDPEDVSILMRSVKNKPGKEGKRLFKPSDFLTPSQIAGFFSRMAVNKRKLRLKGFTEEDQDAETDANNFRELAELANV